MATKTTETDLTRGQLIEVVRTGKEIKGVGKMRALAALGSRERKDVGDILLGVIADKQEAPRFRHMASVGLYKMGGTRAVEALSKAARHADESSAAMIAVGLSRIGTADHMGIVEELEKIAAPSAKNRAEFAANLLAYRYGLDSHDVKAPAGRQLQELTPKGSKKIEIAKARANDAARAFEALADEPLKIDLTTETAQRIVCEPNTFVWLWARDTAVNGFSVLAKRKGVAGVLFRKSRFENAFSLSAIGLGTPIRGGVRLTVHRSYSGMIMYSGVVAGDGSLELRARNHPGLAAVDVRAIVEPGRVEVKTAKVAAVVREAKTPKQS